MIDDESDYFSVDSNKWLSSEQRAKLRMREEEIRDGFGCQVFTHFEQDTSKFSYYRLVSTNEFFFMTSYVGF